MPHQHLTTRTIPFADTDLAGIVHFTHFLRYMEDTEHDFYRVLGLSVHAETETGWIGWPRIEVQCRYVRPLRFEEVVEVQLLVRGRTEATIDYAFLFRRPSDTPPRPLAFGAMTVACAARDTDRDTLKSHPIPTSFADRIKAAPAEMLVPWERGIAGEG